MTPEKKRRKRKPKRMRPDGTLVRSLEQCSPDQPLTMAEEKFVHLVCDPTDTRTIPQKAKSCGYKSRTYPWDMLRAPHIAKAIAVLRKDYSEQLEHDKQQVLASLKKRATQALTLDERAANEAAEIFLRATGSLDGEPSRGPQINVFALVGANVLKAGGAAGTRVRDLPRELEVKQANGNGSVEEHEVAEAVTRPT